MVSVHDSMTALADLEPEALAQQFVQWGYKPSHAARVLRSFYGGREIVSFVTSRLRDGV